MPGQYAPEFDAVLIKAVQSPDESLYSRSVLEQGHQLPDREGIESIQQKTTTGSISRDHHVFSQWFWCSFLDQIDQGLTIREGIGLCKEV